MPTLDSLYFRHAYNDLIKNKAVNAAIVAILVLSAFLMATGAMVMERVLGSVEELFEQAKPPHYLQMHKGDYDRDALQRFAAGRPEIDAWLIEEMLGYDGAAIAWNRPSTGESGGISDSLIDNLFVTQNAEFDFLIDASGAIVRPSPGEVYVPVAYRQRYGLQVGDKLEINSDSGAHPLQIRGFVRDSQMASSIPSATRFLISDADFEELASAGGGTPEIIVEYRLTDPALVPDFERAYEADQALPASGQAVTFPMVRMINALSDGLVAVALMLVSLLLIAIALLNVRFVIRGTLAEEVREIGAMKAIGLPSKEIGRLYLIKYSILTLVACVIGGGLAVVATNLLTRSIRVNFAVAPASAITVAVPVLALLLVYLFVLLGCRQVLASIRKMQVVGALVHGSTLDERQTLRRAKRQAARVRPADVDRSGSRRINRWLALRDLRSESRQWVLIPIVFFLTAVLVALPMNLLSTFNSPHFVTYLGMPQNDLMADLRYLDDVDAARDDLLATMRGDDQLTNLRVYANVLFQAEGAEGLETLRAAVGDYSDDTVSFEQGGRPSAGEIALSVLNADKYGVQPGDALTIHRDGVPTRTVVSGIYSDLTDGGYTAKLQGEVTSDAVGYTIYADTVADVDVDAVAAAYNEGFPRASFFPVQKYVQQTFSYVTGAFKAAAILSLTFGIGIALLVTSLFLKLRLTSDRTKIGLLSAIGFSAAEIAGQVRAKTIISVATGTILGLTFAATAGESLVGGLISLAGLGISQLTFLPDPLLVYLAYPLLLAATGYLAAVLLTARFGSVDKSSWLKG